ncbi:Mor transcription activator family protein [uncultured Helicobacter sp.]|uniref:Mor transcription activator family protein n=1 Tax=uncultured Helicobacter sp. TaxID=175537 RepID=UPI00262FC8DB|nr:Mor transcription activator family protein [uncultured Helicobacter sp.]
MKDNLLENICESYKNGMSWEKIYKKYGGVSIYIPKVSPSAKEGIIKECNGYNFAFLAHKYNLSERKVREIVREGKNKEKGESKE